MLRRIVGSLTFIALMAAWGWLVAIVLLWKGWR